MIHVEDPSTPINEPNQYSTPCYVVYRDGVSPNQQTNFSDLQMAYLHVKALVEALHPQDWYLMSWEDTIENLYEYHMEDESGVDVATYDNCSFTIYYNI